MVQSNYWDLVLALILTGLALSILLLEPGLVLLSYLLLLILLVYALFRFIRPWQMESTSMLIALLVGLLIFTLTILLWLNHYIIFPPLSLLYLMGITTVGLIFLDILSRRLSAPESEWRGEPPVRKKEPSGEPVPGKPEVRKKEPPEEEPVVEKKSPKEEPSLKREPEREDKPKIKEDEIRLKHDAETLQAAELETTAQKEEIPPESATPEEETSEEEEIIIVEHEPEKEGKDETTLLKHEAEKEETPEIIIVDHEAEKEDTSPQDEAIIVDHTPKVEEVTVDHTPEEEEIKGPLIPRDEDVEIITPEHAPPPAEVKREEAATPPEKGPEEAEAEKGPEEKRKSFALVTREKEVKVTPVVKPVEKREVKLPWIERQEKLDSRKNYLPLDLFLAGILSLLGMWLALSAPDLGLLKTVLAVVLVLFLPGFSLVSTIFTRKDQLASLERMALSVGLSIGITPLVALSLNYTPYGVKLDPLLFILSGLSLIFCLVAYQRRSSLHLYQRYTLLQRGKRSF